jgi:CubicO group peptidase (beta-lactamase class C family)
MRIKNPWKKALILLLALPVGFLLMAAVIIPFYFWLNAEPVHAGASSVPAQVTTPSDPHWRFPAAEAGRLARVLVATENLPGVSVAVGVDGQWIWAGGFGWADVESRLPATTETRYRIGSVAQPLTAAAVGLLVERGRLDLDAPVQRYVTTLPPALGSITTRQAMAHTAGFRHPHIESACPRSPHYDTVADALELFTDESLRFAPGSEFGYSSYGWMLVSTVVESAAGLPYTHFMANEVLMPLGMRGTVADDIRQPMVDRATLYHPRANADNSTGLEFPDDTDYTCYAGAGMYLSTPSDLVRFGLAMDTHTLLDPGTARLLQTEVTLPSGRSTGYGLGWFVKRAAFGGSETLVLTHPGFTIGGTALLSRYPEHGIVIAVASNITFAKLAPYAAQVAALFAAARAARS